MLSRANYVMTVSLCVQFRAGVSWHPSHSPIMGLVSEQEREVLELVQCPQLFMPAQVTSHIAI